MHILQQFLVSKLADRSIITNDASFIFRHDHNSQMLWGFWVLAHAELCFVASFRRLWSWNLMIILFQFIIVSLQIFIGTELQKLVF